MYLTNVPDMYDRCCLFQVMFSVILMFGELVIAGSDYDPSDLGWINTFNLDYTIDTIVWDSVQSPGDNPNVSRR